MGWVGARPLHRRSDCHTRVKVGAIPTVLALLAESDSPKHAGDLSCCNER